MVCTHCDQLIVYLPGISDWIHVMTGTRVCEWFGADDSVVTFATPYRPLARLEPAETETEARMAWGDR